MIPTFTIAVGRVNAKAAMGHARHTLDQTLAILQQMG